LQQNKTAVTGCEDFCRKNEEEKTMKREGQNKKPHKENPDGYC
jgi:hypothetical protein